MSTAKRTAFARVPRNQGNNPSGNQPARARVNIDAAWIRKLHSNAQVNPDLSTVMTKVGGVLDVKVQANGAAQTTIQDAGGKVLADMQDIVRIQTMNSSLTTERKEAQKSDAGTTLQHVVAAVIQVAKDEERFNLHRVNPKFLEVYRSVNTQMRTMTSNIQNLEVFEVPDKGPQYLIKNMLIEFATRTRVAVGEFLMVRASAGEDDTLHKLNHFLRKHNVPNYVFGRLTGSLLNFRQTGFDIVSVFFPSDPAKGFLSHLA